MKRPRPRAPRAPAAVGPAGRVRGRAVVWLAAACAAAGLGGAEATSAAVTPVQKVVELLNGMIAKGNEEKHQEKVAFASFSEFCRHTEDTKEKAIKTAESQIVSLEDTISSAEADIDRLSAEIGKLESDIDGWAAEKAKSTDVRKKEKSDYQVSADSYAASINALERAITTLKSKEKDATQSAATAAELLQHLAAPPASPASGPALRAAEVGRVLRRSLLEVSAEADAAPEANAYEFQSSTIVGTLEKLRLKFQDEKEQVEKDEMNRKHAFELVMQRLSDDTKYAEETKSRKGAQRGEAQAELADAQGSLEETKATKVADEQILADLRANCETKSQEFEHRQKLRTEELEAISKAIEVISSPEVAGAAQTHLPSALLQRQRPRGPPPAAALLQLRADGPPEQRAAQERAAAFLAKQAEASRSAVLAAVAQHASGDPFGKVKQMIKDLLARLLDEANQEADHKGWCDEELQKNGQSRSTLSAEVEELSAKEEELSSLEAKLKREIGELNEEIADLDASVKKAVEERGEEKASNEATIGEAKSAQDAVLRATKALQEFYAKASEATALLQNGQAPEEPATWDKEYKGMQGESKGVLGMLDVIHSDFARLEAETTVAEGDAHRRHKKFLEDSEIDRAVKDKEMRHKGYKRDSTLRILRETTKELAGTQEELEGALQYFEKLKPACIDTGLSYKERVAKRKEEIQSLKEALRILGGEEMP